MISPLEIFRIQFKEGKLYTPQAPHDPECKQIDQGIFECEGYRCLTTEELTHVDFPYRFGPLTTKTYKNVYCGGYEEVVEEPVEYNGKIIMKVYKRIYDYEY